MKLILHIGTGKTGTTSIQNFFAECSAELEGLGVLYPVERSVRKNHILFMGGFVRGDKYNIPHDSIYMGNFDRYKSDFDMFWSRVLLATKRANIHTVVISAEQLFRDFSDKSIRQMKDFVAVYFDSVQVVAYVRSPVSDYLSRIAQNLRVGKEMSTPRHRSLRNVLEYYESQFPGCVTVNAFAREQLQGGDVIQDFVVKYVPEAKALLDAYNQRFLNTSLPEPLLVKMQEARVALQPVGAAPKIGTRALVQFVSRQYMRRPKDQRSQKGLVLKPEVADFLSRSAVDYLWLRDKYGVQFSDLDYSVIQEMDNPYDTAKTLYDVAVVDHEGVANLQDVGLPQSFFMRGLVVAEFVVRKQMERLYSLYFGNSAIYKALRGLYSK